MDNYVINPKTSRLIKKGGKVHRKLIKEGVLEKLARLDQVEIKEGDNAQEEAEKLQKTLPPFKKVVKIKNKLHVRDRQADQYFLDIIDELLPDANDLMESNPMPGHRPKLTRQHGRFKIREEEESEEESDEADL